MAFRGEDTNRDVPCGLPQVLKIAEYYSPWVRAHLAVVVGALIGVGWPATELPGGGTSRYCSNAGLMGTLGSTW